MKKTSTLLIIAFFCLFIQRGNAQRFTDKLDRGLVAIPANSNWGSGSGNFISWRIFGEEYYDVTYNLYRDGQLIGRYLDVSNFTDTSGDANSRYSVAAVVKGVEQNRSREITRWDGGYLDVPVQPVYDRNGADVTSSQGYILNDVSLGDVDGDGISELVVKRLNTKDLRQTSNKVAFNFYECYNIKGDKLWSIDMGPNLMAGADEQFDLVLYDWDEDGKCELLMRGTDNMIIHMSDGRSIKIGDMTFDSRWNGIEYTTVGAEYLLYMDGETARPYDWDGQSENYTPMKYPLPRYDDGETTDLLGSSAEGTIWGGGIPGHRPTKHFFGAPFLDGRHASIFLARGIYTREKMVAFDVNPKTHELTERWRWKCYDGGNPYFGCGYHNYIIADVDWDGRDEIVYGSMVVDDNGNGLSTTGLGHGDAQHCSDLDPYRHGQEQFACNESAPSMNYRNATTSQIYYRLKTNADDGRALCGNFCNDYPGCVGRSTASGMVSTVADKIIPEISNYIAWNDLNFRIYWDGDLCEEVVNSPGTERDAIIIKPGRGRIFGSTYCQMNNYTKNNPGATGDIFGDWREEIVLRANDSKTLRIYTTPQPTPHRVYTLWHDHQYRQAMVWQCLGYNQPPHASFFLGELEGITTPPPPLTMTGRTEIHNGGTISNSSSLSHSLLTHYIVCETNNTEINVEDGASPDITTFNVPSWVQGTNSIKKDGNADIIRTYYTCNVTGGAFGGDMRLVKQGDGILKLPKVDQMHSGNTDIWAGTLIFDGSMLKSDLWLNRFARLESNGGQFKSIKMDYEAMLCPGGSDNVGEISTNELKLGFGSRIRINIDEQSMTSDCINTGSVEIETKDWKYGPKYFSPVIEIEAIGQSEYLPTGRYCIMKGVKEIKGKLSDIIIEGTDSKQKVFLTQENDCIFIQIEDVRQPSYIIWNGNESNIWDFAVAKNFESEGQQSPEAFVTGDKVLFPEQSNQYNIQLRGSLEADTVLVNSPEKYTFGGTGSITGETALVKRGEGTLTINTDNTYTGGTLISGGTVIVNSLSNEYQTYGSLGAVNSSPSKFVIENGGILQNSVDVTQGSPMRMDGDDGGVINTIANFTMNKAISGTVLTKKGGAALILFGTNSVKRLILQSGTVDLRGGTPAVAVELQGGTLIDRAANTAHSIEVPKGKSAVWQLSASYYLAYANKLTGEGTITIIPTNTVSRVRVTGDWSKFQGTVKITNKDIWFPLDASTGLPNGTLDIAEGCVVTNVCRTFTIGKLLGKGALGNPYANFQNSAAVTGSNTWKVGNSSEELGDFTFPGKITDAGGTNKANFVKTGNCKMTVSGVWDNTGTVSIQEGHLRVTSSASLGTGALSITSGATLSGSATLSNSRYTINGTVIPGITLTSATGALDFSGKDVTFNAKGELVVNARKCANEINPGCTSLTNIKKMTMNGTVTVNINSGHILQEGDSIRLWTAETTIGSPKLNPQTRVIDEEQGLYWDDSRLNEGLLFVTSKEAVGISRITEDAEVKAQVFTLNGTMVDTVEGEFRSIDKVIKDKGIPTGVYVIRISDGKATVTRKIIIR